MQELELEYYEVVKQLEAIEAKKELLRAQITKEVPEEGLAGNLMNFSWMRRKKYEYSDLVTRMEEDLKKEKKIQELEGVPFTETKTLLVKLY